MEKIETCEVCGKEGKEAKKCTFEKCCSCWHGVPCGAAILRAEGSK